MSAFRNHLTNLLDQRGVTGLQRMKAESAITSLLQVIGDVPMSEAKENGLGSIFSLPDDDKYVYVATGVYADGTFDIVREGSFGIRDRLVGWKPGQSKAAYEKELDLEHPPKLQPTKEDAVPEEEPKARRPSYPQPPARVEQELPGRKPKEKRRRAE